MGNDQQRPHCQPGCDRLDGHDGRDPGACMKNGQELAPETRTVFRYELDRLLAVATLYLDAFAPDEATTLPGKLMLQDVEDVVAKYGRRY